MKCYKQEREDGAKWAAHVGGSWIQVNTSQSNAWVETTSFGSAAGWEEIAPELWLSMTMEVLASRLFPGLWPAMAALISGTQVNQCLVCGTPIAHDQRAKYCSGRCKTAAWRSGVAESGGPLALPALPATIAAPDVAPFERVVGQRSGSPSSWISLQYRWDGAKATVTCLLDGCTKFHEVVNPAHIRAYVDQFGSRAMRGRKFATESLLEFHAEVLRNIIAHHFEHHTLPWKQVWPIELVTDSVTTALKDYVLSQIGRSDPPAEIIDRHWVSIGPIDMRAIIRKLQDEGKIYVNGAGNLSRY